MSELYHQFLIYAVSLWRKRWYVALIGWGLCIPGWIGIMALPDRYESQSRVYIDTDSLLSPLLRGISVESNVGQQVDFMQRTLLSRPNIERLMRLADLDLLAKTQAEREVVFKDIAKRVQIVQNQGKNLFSISFADPSPEVAQRVVQSLLSIFVESNVSASRSDIEKARQFLDVQVAQYEKQLHDAEERLADYKKTHLAVLSRTANGASFQQSLETVRSQRTELQGQLDEAKSRRASLRQQLETVPQFLAIDSLPQYIVARGGEKQLPPALASINSRLQDAQKQLDQLSTRFTDNHPDMIAAKRQVAALKEQYAETEKKLKSEPESDPNDPKAIKTTIPNTVYDQVKLKLVDIESTITTLERHIEAVDAEARKYEELAATAPNVEAELATLNRDYGVLRKNYDELVGRREAVRMSDAVETTGDKIQFRIVDPPQIPTVPSGPPRLLLMSAVMFFALGGGLVFAFLMAQLDDTFFSVENLRESVGLPVLGSISRILTPLDRRLRLFRTLGFAVSMGCLLLTYGAIAVMLLRNIPLTLT
jgi:polysaccharide chain length determinant protein (PEP-CTERM system associated)